MDNLKDDLLLVLREVFDFLDASRIVHLSSAIFVIPVLTMMFGPPDQWISLQELSVSSSGLSVQEVTIQNYIALSISLVFVSYLLIYWLSGLAASISGYSSMLFVCLSIPVFYLTVSTGSYFFLGLLFGLFVTARPSAWVFDRFRSSFPSFR